MIEQNHLDLILEWIDYSFGHTAKSNKKKKDLEQNLDNLIETQETAKRKLFNTAILSQEMIEFMFYSKTLSHENKEIIFNHLVK